MKYEIRHRYTGKVLYTAEIDVDEKTSEEVKKGLAVREAV